jgi:hypothetical protein
MEIGGKKITKSLTLGEMNENNFLLDFKDILGNRLEGEVKVKVTVAYKYNLVYYSSSSGFGQSWATAGTGSMNVLGREKVEYTSSTNITLYIEDIQNSTSRIGNGWLSSNHIQDIQTDRIKFNSLDAVTGNGVIDAVVDSKGNVYYTQSNRIYKLDRDGETSIYAGTGESGFSGDGGLATNATFKSLYGLGIDSSDNIYIFDLNFRLRKIDANSQIITTIAGTGESGFSGDGGLATDAKLNYSQYTYSTSAMAHDIAEDASGNIYFPDYKNHRIRKIDTNGIITTVVGNGSPGFSGDGGLAINARLNTPTDIDFDSKGNMYIADWRNSRIRKVDTNGIITTVAGGGSSRENGILATEVQLSHPYGIAIDQLDNLLIADEYALAIRYVDSYGVVNVIAGSGAINGTAQENSLIYYPYDVDTDFEGNVYIASQRVLSKISV